PFSVFFSEFGIALSAASLHHFILMAVFLILLAIIFAGIAVTTLKMFFGNTDRHDLRPGEINKPGIAAIITLFAIIIVSGIYMPEALNNMLHSAALIIRGGN
ncbi:MAG: hydrogenase 4 subunit F, partial [Bacillota bacterium]|nr:hydrogenase 4 subunit F [Bacillota bacterium]